MLNTTTRLCFYKKQQHKQQQQTNKTNKQTKTKQLVSGPEVNTTGNLDLVYGCRVKLRLFLDGASRTELTLCMCKCQSD